MAALSDYLEGQLLNHIFRSGVYTKPSTVAIALTSGVALDCDSGSTIPELPSGSSNYLRVNLGSPETTGNFVWNSVGTDETTVFRVNGVSSSGQAIGMSGNFYPLYLNLTSSNNADRTNTAQLIGFSYGYQFREFPCVTFYSPQSLAQSGMPVNSGTNYPLYDGNGFIKNSSQIVFNTALTEWGWVSGIAILDHATVGSGNLLMYAKLENPRYIYTGDNVKIDTNSLEISLK